MLKFMKIKKSSSHLVGSGTILPLVNFKPWFHGQSLRLVFIYMDYLYSVVVSRVTEFGINR